MKKSTKKVLLSLLVIFTFFTGKVFSQVSGVVFRDFNANGTRESSASFTEPYVSNITVKATLANGTTYSTTTDVNGAYSFTSGQVPSGSSVRIEFVPNFVGDYASVVGSSNGTNVQFTTAPSSTINFAVNAIEDYWDNSVPPVIIMAAEPKAQKTGASAARWSLIQLADSTKGVPTTAPNIISVDTSHRPAIYSQTGGLWGIAYQKKLDRFFASAVLKRFVDTGAYGLGGIYYLKKSGSDYTLDGGFSLNGVVPSNGGPALNFGSITRTYSNTVSDNNLANVVTNGASRDMDVYAKAEKMSIGNIKFNGVGDSLYIMNLYQRRLVVFYDTLSSAALNGASPSTLAPYVHAYDLTTLPGWPSPAGTGDSIRPWAIQFHAGMGYIGVVSDAITTQDTSKLMGYILQFDPTNVAAGFTTVLTIKFDKYVGSSAPTGEFGCWTNTWPSANGAAGVGFPATSGTSGYVEYPQPVISDISFNEDGSMDIEVRDRFGDQTAFTELAPISGSSVQRESAPRGDLLHACYNAGSWYLEGTPGSCSQSLTEASNAPAGTKWSYGNTGKEYYADISGDARQENAAGAASKLMGTYRVTSVAMDPIDSSSTPGSNFYYTAGLQWNNINTGKKVQNARLMYGGPLSGSNYSGKSNMLGDIEYATPVQPIEIGNRVWKDANGNGIQDAGESPFANVAISLVGPGTDGVVGTSDDVVLASTTSDANGNYYFDSLTIADTRKPAIWTNVSNKAILQGYNYGVRVNLGQTPTGESVSLKTDYYVAPANQGSDDNIDNDALDSTIGGTRYAYFTVNTSYVNHSFDIGLSPKANIGDSVWVDTNGNGRQDAGEPGKSGVKVYLTDCSNVTQDSTTTDANGKYSFTNITPASYKIKFVLPTGYAFTAKDTTIATDTTDSDVNQATGYTDCITLTAGQNNTTVDAGIYIPASLGDSVWVDANANGIQDAGELGKSGVAVTLYASNGTTVVATTTTDANGKYNFTNVVPATYVVGFTLPSGYVFTTQHSGSDTTKDSDPNTGTGKTSQITLVSGQNNPTIDAGIYQYASIGDSVWVDANANGIQDAGELVKSGVTVTLYASNGTTVVATTTTDTNGKYGFSNLVPGTYVVGFTLPGGGYVFTTQHSGSDTTKDSDPNTVTGKTGQITLSSGQNNTTVDAGIYQYASLGDSVWVDTNGNGVQDIGEPGKSGVTVTLYGSDGSTVISTTTTDANGKYGFSNLVPNTYVVGFTLPGGGYVFTTQHSGSDTTKDSDPNTGTGKTGQITLTSGQNNTTVDAGIYQYASLGDSVWVDTNGNGKQDVGELGVSGVTVTLYGSDGTTVISTTTTDANGKYGFSNLVPGAYVVGFTSPGGYVFTTQHAGSDTTKDSDPNKATGKTSQVIITSGQNNTTVDAGVYVPASIGNFVWSDLNGNGLQDAGEPGLQNVKVYLMDSLGTTKLDSTTTDANGKYSFTNLIPSKYIVHFDATTLPSGYIFSPQNVGSDDTIDSDPNVSTGLSPVTTLVSGQYDSTVDAGVKYSLLPVVLTSFNGQSANGKVSLTWQTATELNASYYQVERSADGIHFSAIGNSVSAHGAGAYNAEDATPLSGISYYRLRMVDNDGSSTYSTVVSVKLVLSALSIDLIKPNPFTSSVDINVTVAENSRLKISMYNAAGQLVHYQENNALTGLNSVSVVDLDKLSNGIYIITINTINASIQKKLVKIQAK